MVVRVEVAPAMLAWARERSGRAPEDFERRFPKLESWERGESSPTLKQLEGFAQFTYTPIGYLFLPEPPIEKLPIPDFRTIGNTDIERPSPNLLDTIYLCEQRQEWYRNFAINSGVDTVRFVGSLDISVSPESAAEKMRAKLRFGLEERREIPSWAAALRTLTDQAEANGVLVMISGVVGSNTHRKLDPQEFRGFALIDEHAPLIFVNGADTKAAQIFTVAHELAHVWLGQSAVSRPDLASGGPKGKVVQQPAAENWCNRVAAEFLVPMHSLRQEFRKNTDLTDELDRLARYYKVSTLVILRRIFDAGYLSWVQFGREFREELARVLGIQVPTAQGGNFYNTQPMRVSKRFARAIISDTLEGQTLHREALRLLGFSKISTLEELSHRLGVA